ncbi:hypothetical protein FHY06_002031 [Variovorax sp. BK613]|nr:hypothetical protein [Variovorax sp. BK613]
MQIWQPGVERPASLPSAVDKYEMVVHAHPYVRL